jgi:hypothetical protein
MNMYGLSDLQLFMDVNIISHVIDPPTKPVVGSLDWL